MFKALKPKARQISHVSLGMIAYYDVAQSRLQAMKEKIGEKNWVSLYEKLHQEHEDLVQKAMNEALEENPEISVKAIGWLTKLITKNKKNKKQKAIKS